MEKLIKGLHQFQSKVFSSHKDLFEKLSSEGQYPEALFITCSDSRISPTLITQSHPGDLFVLRNAGNIVPPYGAANGGEGATIEYALMALGIKDIVVCGHSHCGAVTGLINQDNLGTMPEVKQWLHHAEATRRIVTENYADMSGAALINAAVQENVLVQIENLRTHPTVAVGLSKGELKLHAWVYKIETGVVFSYHPEDSQFLPITPASEPSQGGIRRAKTII